MTPSAQYSRMPGGGISRRPLHIIVLADCSWGMKGEKIQALNYAIADMMPHLEEWERDQEQAQVFIRAIAFATEPRWHIKDPVPVAGIRWKPLQAVPKRLINAFIVSPLRIAFLVSSMAGGYGVPDALMQYATPDLEKVSIDIAHLQRKRDRVIDALREIG